MVSLLHLRTKSQQGCANGIFPKCKVSFPHLNSPELIFIDPSTVSRSHCLDHLDKVVIRESGMTSKTGTGIGLGSSEWTYPLGQGPRACWGVPDDGMVVRSSCKEGSQVTVCQTPRKYFGILKVFAAVTECTGRPSVLLIVQN